MTEPPASAGSEYLEVAGVLSDEGEHHSAVMARRKKAVDEMSAAHDRDDAAQKRRADELDAAAQAQPQLDDVLTQLEEKPVTDEDVSLMFAPTEDIAAGRRRVEELRHEIEDTRIAAYLDMFEDETREEQLHIGSISVEEVQEEERRLREEHLRYQAHEAGFHKRRLQQLALQTESAKRAVDERRRKSTKRLAERDRQFKVHQRMDVAEMHKAFRRAESRLVAALNARKAEVKTTYGDLTLAQGMYGGNAGRKWRVDWRHAPQPIQVKVDCLRGVRDKLPRGQYSLMVSLYDRLGGHLLRWSKLRGQEWGGATLPVAHGGRFTDVEIAVQQSLFTVCPAQADVRPGMVLTFELFIMRGQASPVDRVVAWGSFPLVTHEFELVSGFFKVPMLRGVLDPGIDLHGGGEHGYEGYLSADVDRWMGTLYFQITPLPRYTRGQKEFEVELQFSSALLGYPAREAETDGSTAHDAFGNGRRDNAALGQEEERLGLRDPQRPKSGVNAKLRKRLATRAGGSRPFAGGTGNSSEEGEEGDGTGLAASSLDAGSEPAGGGGTANTPVTAKVEVEAGLSYTMILEDEKDAGDRRQAFTMTPKRRQVRPKPLTREQQLERHTFSVQPQFPGRRQMTRKEKMRYIFRHLRSELGYHNAGAREFWFSVLCLVFLFWLRIYVHYFGQWLYLTADRVPVTEFSFGVATVSVNYQSSLLLTREVVAVVLMGPLLLLFLFALLVGASLATKRVAGSFPSLGYRFISAWGILATLDPLLILLVDLCYQRWDYGDGQVPIGDSFKLFWHFRRVDDSGVPGIFLTVFIYTILTFTGAAVLYLYLLKVHMNGRMVDLYQRLTAGEDVYLVPFDTEVSNRELGDIVRKAERWRGQHGERRKVAVYDYVWSEEEVDVDGVIKQAGPGAEVTTHVSVHTLSLDGQRDLYRHFLRLPDGAIVELFGEISTGLDTRVRQALDRSEVNIEEFCREGTIAINAALSSTGGLVRGTSSRGKRKTTLDGRMNSIDTPLGAMRGPRLRDPFPLQASDGWREVLAEEETESGTEAELSAPTDV